LSNNNLERTHRQKELLSQDKEGLVFFGIDPFYIAAGEDSYQILCFGKVESLDVVIKP